MLNKNDLKLKKYRRLTAKVLALDEKYAALSDAELQNKTLEFRERLAKGEKLNNLLVEAYATIREADYRVLGMKPYDTQVLGAMILNDRNVAEMGTGEGKTLTATMPMYLNGLQGPGAFLVTSSSYLSNRDAEQMGQVYRWLGLTIGSSHDEDTDEQKKAMYQADIVYTTYSELGFDYLFDNLASNPDDKIQSELRYSLVDEVDSVLLDLAQMPLVIAGAPKVQSNLFETSDKVVKNLERDVDYELSEDEKEVWFTADGVRKMAKYFGLPSLVDRESSEIYRHLVLALRANHLFTINRDYVVEGDKLMLLDEQDGRKLPGIHLDAGMHQALEAKEHVTLSDQQKTMASVTYQNLFGMFKKLAGMTGTAETDKKEFMSVYGLDVLEVPPHKPNIRVDLPDKLFINTREKLTKSLEVIKEAHAKGQPVLVETGSVSLSELYSLMLLQNGLAHNVLNAKNSAREAQIIKGAGQLNAITVATSMAGRGTDIKLGKGVAEIGGLLVLGTERMSSPRVDNQLRGRAGRQGDPGITQFYLSLEDRVVIENGPKNLEKTRKKFLKQEAEGKRPVNAPITTLKWRKVVSRAQNKAATTSADERMGSVQYDNVQRNQQDFIYQFRDGLMDYTLTDLQELVDKLSKSAFHRLAHQTDLTSQELVDYINNTIDYDYIATDELIDILAEPEKLEKYLQDLFAKRLTYQMKVLPAEDQQIYFLRLTILRAIDNAWIEQVDNLHQLRGITSSRSIAQHDPIASFQLEAVKGFKHMTGLFWDNAVANISLSEMVYNPDGTASIDFP